MAAARSSARKWRSGQRQWACRRSWHPPSNLKRTKSKSCAACFRIRSQRYLLADEVGLGKTIEAGVLIRQCVLDAPNEAAILILAPEPLIRQWRGELSNRFFPLILPRQIDPHRRAW